MSEARGSLGRTCAIRPQDIDSIRKLDDELRRAAAAVAERHALGRSWLNDNATAFAPVTFREDTCDVLLEHPSLRVLGIPWRDLFLMKMGRLLPSDQADMRTIWPYVVNEFPTAASAVDAYYEAYPDVPPDEYVADELLSLLERGGFRLPLN